MKFNLNQKQVIILIILLALSIILNTMLFIGINKNGDCFNDPFVYGAKKVSEQAESPIICRCDITKGNYNPFYFTEEGVIIENG